MSNTKITAKELLLSIHRVVGVGTPLTFNSLADIYMEEKNYDEMVKYLLKSIYLGDTSAMYKLGQYYIEINDYSKAIKYLQMASNLGDEQSKQDLNDLEEYIKYVNKTSNKITKN